ncbi:MAG: hypothetical protein M3323_01035 [Actinomycetota bacterium]|nr:hypothetical protein [Actinomycetota bacterium]
MKIPSNVALRSSLTNDPDTIPKAQLAWLTIHDSLNENISASDLAAKLEPVLGWTTVESTDCPGGFPQRDTDERRSLKSSFSASDASIVRSR